MDSSGNSTVQFVEWNNSISLADILSLLMLIATFITILLVLIQRHDAAKPIVIIRSSNKTLEIKYGGMSFQPKEAIQVGCFGNCLAKDVNIEAHAVLSKPKSSFKTISINDSEFAKINCSKGQSLIRTTTRKLHFDVINNGETNDLMNDYSHIFDVFAYVVFEIAESNKDSISSNDWTQKLLFKISYKDIHNKSYVTFIEMSMDFILIELNNRLEFCLKCKTISHWNYSKCLKDKQKVLGTKE